MASAPDVAAQPALGMVMTKPVATSVISSAMDRVLHVTELLELILLNSTPLTVLRSTSVCRKIKDTIAASVKLQQKLCLEADFSIPENERLPNPLLDGPSSGRTDVHLTFAAMSRKMADPPHQRISLVPGSEILLQLTRIPRPGGNAAKMFLTQPPTTELTIWSHDHDIFDGSNHHRREEPVTFFETVVRNKHGVTWGDACMALVEEDSAIDLSERVWQTAEMLFWPSDEWHQWSRRGRGSRPRSTPQ